MKKKNIVLTLLLVFCMLFVCTACDETAQLDPITFASYEKGFEVTAPGDWSRTDENDAGTCDLVLESLGGNAAFMIMSENKSDYNMDYNEYYDALVDMVVYQINTVDEDKINLKDSPNITINGYDARGCEFNYSDGTTNLYMMMHLFETEDKYVRVVGSTLKSGFEDYRQTFIEMAETLVVK